MGLLTRLHAEKIVSESAVDHALCLVVHTHQSCSSRCSPSRMLVFLPRLSVRDLHFI